MSARLIRAVSVLALLVIALLLHGGVGDAELEQKDNVVACVQEKTKDGLTTGKIKTLVEVAAQCNPEKETTLTWPLKRFVHSVPSANDTTPDVTDSMLLEVCSTANPTTITDLDGGVNGQVVTLLFNDGLFGCSGQTTIADADPFFLTAPFTSTARDTLTLVRSRFKWIEVSRSLN